MKILKRESPSESIMFEENDTPWYAWKRRVRIYSSLKGNELMRNILSTSTMR